MHGNYMYMYPDACKITPPEISLLQTRNMSNMQMIARERLLGASYNSSIDGRELS